MQVRLPARSSRQFDRQIVAEKGMKVPQRLEARKFNGNQTGPRQLELPPTRPVRDFPGS